MLDKAIFIAVKAHQGQKDKAGQPYILHLLRVMFSRKNDIEKICAVLHDVIEDTDITLEYLKDEGFSAEVLTALDALTRRIDENYDDFIDRIIQNRIACHVKLADLYDNMDLSRIPNPSEDDYRRIEKYRKATDRIFDILEEGDDSEFQNTREIELSGCVSVPIGCSEDEFAEKFIDFVERNHWSFGGGMKAVE